MTIREGQAGVMGSESSHCMAERKHSYGSTVCASTWEDFTEGWGFQKQNSELTSRNYSWEEEKRARTDVATQKAS